MLTYIEHYPHYMGTRNTKAQIELQDFVLLVLLGKEDEYEVDDGADEVLKNVKGSGPYAFTALLTNDHIARGNKAKMAAHLRRILKSFEKNGFYAAQWEEGSHAISLEGFEKKAMSAVARIEAQLAEDEFDF